MHLTLRFIGEVNAAQVTAIKAALASIHFNPFAMHLQGVGQFPPRGTARVLWVGVTTPDDLYRLARQIETALTTMGLPPADKPFAAHITLARLKTPPVPEALRQFFKQNANFQTPAFGINNFILYSSILASSGATYHREAVVSAR
jgi:2'-5' RNA ligase